MEALSEGWASEREEPLGSRARRALAGADDYEGPAGPARLRVRPVYEGLEEREEPVRGALRRALLAGD
jgi:hypothetical protein